MNAKRPSSTNQGAVAKRPRRTITLEVKLDVLKRYERGERTVQIGRSLGLNESTLRTIRDSADKIHESCKTATNLSISRVSYSRTIMEKMESQLVKWIEDEKERGLHVPSSLIKEMAKTLYEDLKSSEPEAEVKPFTASSGWLERFKNRHGFLKLKIMEKPSAGTFHDVFRSFVIRDGYSARQVFTLQETGLFWKRMPTGVFFYADAKPRCILKAQNDCCSLLLGSNAAGDCKLKPLMIYHIENPRELKGYSKIRLPVVLRHSKKGVLTSAIFADYFESQLHLELKAYCKRENLPFKILLLLEVSPGIPSNLADLSKNVKVLFMPKNIAQEMHQGVNSLFAALYFRRVFASLTSEIDKGGKLSVPGFFEKLNIKMAIDIIGESWAEVSEQVMKEAWKGLWPEIVDTSPSDILDESVRNAELSIIDMIKIVGITGIDEQNIHDLLASQGEPVNNEDFPLPEDELDNEEEEESASETDAVRTLSTQVLAEIFKLKDQIAELIDENDPDRERSSRVSRELQNVLADYRDLYREKRKHASHLSLDKSVVKCE